MDILSLGMMRVGVCSPELRVADVEFNTSQIIDAIRRADADEVGLLVFPELCITGYSCADLFYQPTLLQAAENALERIADELFSSNVAVVVGLPVALDGRIFNCAAFISGGKICGLVPKTFIPNTNEFYEKRWFASATACSDREIRFAGRTVQISTKLLFQAANFPECVVGIEICEDLWSVIPPSSRQAIAGATILINPSASDELLGKSDYRRSLVSSQSARCLAAYLYAGAGAGESTTDVVFGGHSMIAENGQLLAETPRFEFSTQIATADIDLARLAAERRRNSSFKDEVQSEDFRIIPFNFRQATPALRRVIPQSPFVPQNPSERTERCREIFALQSTALAKRLRHIGATSVVLGVSGGLDSTLALLACVKTFDKLGLERSGIVAVSMSGFGTTRRTKSNAEVLATELGTTLRLIPIDASVRQHFRDIGHDETVHDLVYENAQARERTQILMDVAHQTNAIVVGTGDLSELALGWCTYNGDHISMYGINSGVPKTLVRYLVEFAAGEATETVAGILKDILDTPVSPELLPPSEDGTIAQKTEDTIGPYILHDFFLYYAIRCTFPPRKIYAFACAAFEGEFTQATIKSWLAVFYKRFFTQQFKRSCLPDGVKIGSVALSPRADWRMPSDAQAGLWIREVEEL